MPRDVLHASTEQATAFRLARSHLLDGRPSPLAAVCRDVCGIQAQVMSAAELSLAARVPRLEREKIQAALCRQRTLVKISAMRGTLHLLAAEEHAIYVQALKRSRLRHMHRVMGNYGGISPQLSAEVSRAAVDALRNGPMPPGELKSQVLSQGMARGRAKKFFESAWWGVVREAMVKGLVCYGPNRGHETTLVRTVDWLPRQLAVSESDAKQILLRRYLSAYGPATPQDFCKWSGIFGSEMLETWQQIGNELVEVLMDGRKAWLLKRDARKLRQCKLRAPAVRLLPNFDSFLLAHANKNHLVEPRFYAQVFRKAGWISPVVLWNGKAVGVWKTATDKQGLSIVVKLFKRAPSSVFTELKSESERIGRFLQKEFRLQAE